jgi:hypothetical protein
MQTRRLCASLLALLLLPAAQADVLMTVSVDKAFYQQDAFRLDFDQGSFDVRIRDGFVFLAPCAGDPSFFQFGPDPLCPLGITGLIANGDVDGDGLRDDNLFWSIDSVVRALIIEPARPDLVTLLAAPPSKLVRPLPAFFDNSLVVFYNVSRNDMEQLDVTRYFMTIRYGSVPQVETTNTLGEILVAGNLNVVITGRDIAGSPLSIPVAVAAGATGSDVATSIRLALNATPAVTNFYSVGGADPDPAADPTTIISLTERVVDGNDPTLNIGVFAGTATGDGLPIDPSQDTVEGAFKAPAAASKQMREELPTGTYIFSYPRLNNPDLGSPVILPGTITPMIEALDRNSRSNSGFRLTSGNWDGDFYQLDPRLIHDFRWTGNDRSNILRGDQIYFSIRSADESSIVFPPRSTNPLQLPDPTVQEYTLPPGFGVVGDEGVINVEFERFLRTTGVAFDTSKRSFRAKVRMVDSYDGFARTYYELGTSTALTPAGADKDGDGMTNINEFGLEFPTIELIESLGLNPVILGFGKPAANNARKTPVLPAAALDIDNHIVVRASVRPLSGTSLKYQFLQETTSGTKTKTKAIKAGRDWTITRVTETEQLVGFPGVFVDHEFVVLRSVRPVADPTAPLPTIKVVVTPLAL